jgi:hypothetical protein
MSGFPYVWFWRARPQPSRKGERCRVLVRGTMNSALVEFEDGYRVVTSRNGLRRGPDGSVSEREAHHPNRAAEERTER